jgi:hypothetical protein
MPNLYYFCPMDSRGLGFAYNKHAALLPNDSDWAVFTDLDALLFCSQDIEGQLQEAIRDHPEFQVFTSMTTRLCAKCQQQVQTPGIREETNLVKLKEYADHCAKTYRGRIKVCRGFFAGFFFAFPKRIWKRFPFPETGSQAGRVLGIDSAWSRTLKAGGVRVGVMEGIVSIHFYRLDTGEGNISHLSDPTHNQKLRNPWDRTAGMDLPRHNYRRRIEIASATGNPSISPGQTVILNPAIKPPGGYKYQDSDGMVHFATDFPKLVKTLTDYRRRIGRDIGLPEKEIMDYFFKKYPRCCIVRG